MNYVRELLFYNIHVQTKGNSTYVRVQISNFSSTRASKKLYFLYATYARSWFVNPWHKQYLFGRLFSLKAKKTQQTKVHFKFFYSVQIQTTHRSIHRRCSERKGVLRNLAKFTGVTYNFIKKETLAQVFSCEFCQLSRSTITFRTPPVTASRLTNLQK